MKHINLTNWKGSITDWTKLNYIYGGLDDSYAVKGNLRIDKDNYNYVEFRESNNQLQLEAEEGTTSGIDYKAENGSITLTGTNTSSGAVGIVFKFNEFNGTYGMLLDGYKNVFQNGVQIRLNGTYVDTIATTSDSKVLTNKHFNEIRLIVASGMTINATIRPMVISGSTAPTIYEPYFEGKKYVITETLGIVDLGGLTVTVYNADRHIFSVGTIANLKQYQNTTIVPDMITPGYTTVSQNDTWANGDISVRYGTNNVYICDTDYSTAEALKTALNGVMLTYALETPVIEVVE